MNASTNAFQEMREAEKRGWITIGTTTYDMATKQPISKPKGRPKAIVNDENVDPRGKKGSVESRKNGASKAAPQAASKTKKRSALEANEGIDDSAPARKAKSSKSWDLFSEKNMKKHRIYQVAVALASAGYSPTSAKIRAAEIVNTNESDDDEDDDGDDDDDDDDKVYTESCDTIRRKLRNLFDSGVILQTHWLKAHNVNSNSYGRFMKLKGRTSGMDNSTYVAACRYFAKNPAQPSKKMAKTVTGTAMTTGGSSSSTVAAATSFSGVPDISSIELEGESEDLVEIYDSCDEVRRKISAHLKKTGQTQADFLRCLGAQFHTSQRKIQSKQLNEFREKKGPVSGNTSAVYYGAYVYFEKLRVKEGKEKTKHRLEMEGVWERGMERKKVLSST